MLGSFIWEWQGQGVADLFPDKTKDYYFGLDALRQENNKGIVTGLRVPKPELWFVKMAYSPVAVKARSVGANGAVPLVNHYGFTDLNELTCRWTTFNGAKTLKTGAMKINCAPLQNVTANFPIAAGATMLRLNFLRADGSSVVAANLPVEGAPDVAAVPAAMKAGDAVFAVQGADGLRVGNSAQEIAFDKASGNIRSWRVGTQNLLVGGPILNLGELKGGNERDYFQAKKPPVTSNARIKTMPGINGALRVSVVSDVKKWRRWRGAGHAELQLRHRAQRRNARELDARLDGARRAFMGSGSETGRASEFRHHEMVARIVFPGLSRRTSGRTDRNGERQRRAICRFQTRFALVVFDRWERRGAWRCWRKTIIWSGAPTLEAAAICCWRVRKSPGRVA